MSMKHITSVLRILIFTTVVFGVAKCQTDATEMSTAAVTGDDKNLNASIEATTTITDVTEMSTAAVTGDDQNLNASIEATTTITDVTEMHTAAVTGDDQNLTASTKATTAITDATELQTTAVMGDEQNLTTIMEAITIITEITELQTAGFTGDEEDLTPISTTITVSSAEKTNSTVIVVSTVGVLLGCAILVFVIYIVKGKYKNILGRNRRSLLRVRYFNEGHDEIQLVQDTDDESGLPGQNDADKTQAGNTDSHDTDVFDIDLNITDDKSIL